jgi:hypothetical protein
MTLDVPGALLLVMGLGVVICRFLTELCGLLATIIIKHCFVFVSAVMGGIH